MVTSALSFDLQFPHYTPGHWDKKSRPKKQSLPLWLFAPGFFTDFLRLILAHELSMAGNPFAQPTEVREANPPAKKPTKTGPKSRKTPPAKKPQRTLAKREMPKGMRTWGYMRSQYGALAA